MNRNRDIIFKRLIMFCQEIAESNNCSFTYTDFEYDDTCLIFNYGEHTLRLLIRIGEKGGLYRIRGFSPVHTKYHNMCRGIYDSVNDWLGDIFECMGK